MKLVSKHLERDASGIVGLVCEDSEDMWNAYNLMNKGDTVKASTVRKVVSESTTGSTEKSSIRITLTVQVESVEFDATVGVLRINGRNMTENKHIKLGAYHTLDLELNRPFTIGKPEWDIISLERIDSACDVTKKADVAAVVMQEGLANVMLLTQNMTIVRQRIDTPVPRKRKGSTTNYEKGLARFYDQVLQAVLKHVNFDIVKVLIIASPGFVKDQFYQYLNAQAIKSEHRSLVENKSKIVLVHASSGQKHALQEVLQEPAIQARLAETKFAQEVKTLDRFYQILNSDPAKAFYGFKHVSKAAEQGAVEILMIADTLFRSIDISVRKKYIQLVEKVRSMGGQTLVFSSMHTSGEQLDQLTGVAAILHFPLPDLEDEEMEESVNNSHDSNINIDE